MRIHGHREGNIIHWGLLAGGGLGSNSGGWRGWGGTTWVEMPDVVDGG